MRLVRLFAILIFFFSFSNLYSQKGKDGAKIISTNTVVNAFTALTANASNGNTVLTVASSALGANFTSTLTPGDLIMVIQMQGALIKLSPTPVWAKDSTYGAVYNYLNCGNYEFVEVKSIISSTQIEINCGLVNNYSIAGKTQVVRVPRFNSLTIAANGTLTSNAWNGTTGGVLSVEVDGATIINAGGIITATGLGFRGGVANGNGGSGDGSYSGLDPNYGAEKGEGIGSDRITNITHDSLGKYCQGAPGNGGGGGNANNCAGGGGGNAGNILGWNGYGVANVAYSAIFEREYIGRGAVVSSGGGKGGYGTSTTFTPNVTVTGPENAAWGSFRRPKRGGLGGRPLDYTLGKLFMGGGGGAGHKSNTSQSNGTNACSGSAGGGLIFILNYGTISGTGIISSNGANGNNAFGTSATSAQGIDGAGGAGAGGTIVLKSNGAISGITVDANGGTGGNQIKSGLVSTEAQGPGGGGGGGYIAGTNIGFTQNVNGGIYGTTNAAGTFPSFPMNGATSGNSGINNQIITPSFSLTPSNNQTVCVGQSATLTATSNDPSATILWYNINAGGNSISTGTVYITPIFTVAGTYTIYPGTCPGLYRLPIIITVDPPINLAVNNPTICPNQTVTLTATGATSYTWSNNATTTSIVVSPSVTTNYTVTGSNGSCSTQTVTSVTIGSSASIIVNSPTICAGQTAILTASGITTYTWDNGANTPSVSLTPSVTSVYTITGSSNGCLGTQTATVIVNTSPVITANSTTICSGQSTTITASGANTYTWNNGPNSASQTVNPTSTTIYSVTGTNSVGCVSSAASSCTVSVIITPTLSVTSASICASGTATLIANGATSYTWSSGLSSTTGSIVTGNPIVTTVYTVTGSNGVCSSAPLTSTITITAGLSIISPSVSICLGETATLTASGAATYTWLPSNTTGTTFTDSPVSNTTYTVIGANGSCAGSTTVNVDVNAVPLVNVNNAVICSGTSTVLLASGANSYTWSPGGFTTNTISVSPTINPTTYTVIGSNNGCTNTTVSTVSVISTPTITANSASICASGTATLIANGATSYTWSSGLSSTTGSLVTGNPIVTTVYTVTGSDGICSSSPFTSTITITAGLSIISPSVSICIGETATLTASGAATYTWLPSNTTGTTFTDSPVSNTTYTVIGANGSCAGSTTVNVDVNAIPLVNVNNAVICSGTSTVLLASGANSYTWSPGGFTTNTISVSPTLNPTTYTVIGSNNGCTNTTVSTVSVISTPTITANSASICASGTATLIANGATSYTWSSGLSSTTGSVVTGNPIVTTVYTVTGSDGICSSSPFTSTITITAGLSIISPSVSICIGETATLTASGAATYTWLPANTTGTTFTDSPVSNTTYTVIGTNGSCAGSTTVNIDVNAVPLVNVNNAVICSGTSTVLIASGANSYTWSSSGLTTSSISVSPNLNPTTYTVIGSTNGCTNTAVSTVSVLPSPTITVSSSSICATGTGTLTANGATSYTWSSGLSSTTGSVVTGSPSTTTIYTVTGSNGVCSSSPLTSTITVQAISIISPSVAICSGNIATLSANGASTFTWLPMNVNGVTCTVSPTSNTTYTVIGSTGACLGSNTVNVVVNAVPSVSVTNAIICAGTPTVITALGANSYTWISSGLTTNSISITSTINPTTYTVVGSINGCTNIAVSTVSVLSIPTLVITKDTQIIKGATIPLSIASSGTSYTWSPATGLSCINCSNPIASPEVTTEYCVTSSIGACKTSSCLTVAVEVVCYSNTDYSIPNALTPNGDGINDEFCLKGWSDCTSSFYIAIYDRWGEKVFSSMDPDFCWDGKVNGVQLNTAVFVYYVKAEIIKVGNVTKKGNITLIR